MVVLGCLDLFIDVSGIVLCKMVGYDNYGEFVYWSVFMYDIVNVLIVSWVW